MIETNCHADQTTTRSHTHAISKGSPMIFVSRNMSLIVAAAVALTACGPPAAKPVAAAPTAVALLAMEKQANEAYIRGDGKFFQSFLSDNLVMRAGSARLSKADAVLMIEGITCNVKAGWTLSSPLLAKIDNDVYVFSYVSDMQGSCTANGRVEKMPSPVRAATVWVRSGDTWQAAFHGENPIFDPGAATATTRAEEPRQADNGKASVNANANPAANPLTTVLMSAESAV